MQLEIDLDVKVVARSYDECDVIESRKKCGYINLKYQMTSTTQYTTFQLLYKDAHVPPEVTRM